MAPLSFVILYIHFYLQEAMSEGTIGWWVLGLYIRSVGFFLTTTIILSLVLMQVSQNFTFLWLTYWVRNNVKNSTALNVMTLNDHITEKTSILDHGINSVENAIHGLINTTIALFDGTNKANQIPFNNVPNEELTIQPLLANTTAVYTDNFYLEIYFGLAALNLVFTIMRAFLFAYGGVKAASRIHKVLLKVIVKVIILIEIFIKIL